MKCAVAIMLSASVWRFALSIAALNHPGVPGSKNETSHAARPRTVTLPSTYAFATETHAGTGWRIGVCADSRHGALALSRSQRREPITIAAAPP